MASAVKCEGGKGIPGGRISIWKSTLEKQFKIPVPGAQCVE